MPRITNTEKKRNKFADILLSICITVMVYATVLTIASYYFAGEVIPADVFRSFVYFWGAEVITVALRQIFGSDVFDSIRKDKVKEDVCKPSI